MRYPSLLVLAFTAASVVDAGPTSASSQCKGPLKPTAAPGDPHWMQTIKRQGISAYNPNPSTYKVYRNVKDYGAKGDGIADDTEAINQAISDQNRCGQGCASSTRSPAIIFFPSGTYRVTRSIIPYYYTQLLTDADWTFKVGDAKHPPTLVADPTFDGAAVIDAGGGGAQYWTNQNNFFKSVRHFTIDLTKGPNGASGLHWQVAQATTLVNIAVDMKKDSNTQQVGMWMENGSGGFMSDLVFNGGERSCLGKTGMSVGNQQFTVRNLTFTNVQDGYVDGAGVTKLAGGTKTCFATLDSIRQWAEGNKYYDSVTTPTYILDAVNAPNKPSQLLDSSGRIYQRGRTDYADYAADQFASVRDAGAKGDGVTDDTKAIQAFIKKYAACKILYFDAGTYMVTDTIEIPSGSIVVGEVWTTMVVCLDEGAGAKFANESKPRPVVQVGKAGDKAGAEISDMVFSARSGSAGAIVVEWNAADKPGEKGSAAMWDVHIRVGGFAGSDISVANCLKFEDHAVKPCVGAFLGLHITSKATAYLEGTWVWTADHDLEDQDQRQIDVYTGRGILSESKNGPVWLIGTASEHASIVQYSFYNSKNVYAGLIQTETAYYQPAPPVPAPFTTSKTWRDPTFKNGPSGWGLHIAKSEDIFVYGAGHYSFFQNYTSECLTTFSCQQSIVKVTSDSKDVYIYGLSTVGTTYLLNVDDKGIINQADSQNG
ncbi:glycoside hydrolase family 55 protein [Tulasnella calospora MUT 4182]|uniref:Glycoside hydrolase family 55 protein n=1 Tax=Tulasnella calospora MUT 4182 TaxID=1051891 RepID=A0A0C3LCA5_9AGAM|nr:glycoside hydrolase family 55 protein [Tulasnella calospora MUT 4182]